ncbi:MAG: hypothetical protein AAES65_03300 [Candidatus Thiodiazotropha sp. (ex. Lucinoma kazani)]
MIRKLKELGRRVALHYRWHDTVLRALIQHNRHPDLITKQDVDQALEDLDTIVEAKIPSKNHACGHKRIYLVAQAHDCALWPGADTEAPPDPGMTTLDLRLAERR